MQDAVNGSSAAGSGVLGGAGEPSGPGSGAVPAAGATAMTPANAPAGGGAGSTAGGAGQGAIASEGLPDPNAPTGVVFEWPESEPGTAAGSCKPGHYVGQFSCRLYIVATEGPGAFDLAGTIDMQLEQSASGELLRIRDGKFLSASAGAIPAWADIVGELNCATSRFEARLENGKFSVALGLPVPFTEGTFSGPLVSAYDKASAAMTGGEWNMIGELDGFPGSCMDGTWSASWVP